MSNEYQVWKCKVGIKGSVNLPFGADFPMRQAIKRAFKEITGVDAEFCFSGWNASLEETEIRVVEDTLRQLDDLKAKGLA